MAPFPEHSIIYCLRGEGALIIQFAGSEPRVLLNGSGADPEVPLLAPYGIAYSHQQDVVIVSDKHPNRLWFLKFKDEAPGIVLATAEPLASPNLQPCTVSYDQEFGLLVGCYGGYGDQNGGVARYFGNRWEILTPDSDAIRVTHTCWLNSGALCYVTRHDSILWHCKKPGATAERLTGSGEGRVLSPASGRLCELRLRYVQGMYFNPRRNELLVADASLGAIFSLDISQDRYQVVAGRPAITDSSWTSQVGPGPKNVWLGPIRAVGEDRSGKLIWLDGKTGEIFRLSSTDSIEVVGAGLSPSSRLQVAGTQLLAF